MRWGRALLPASLMVACGCALISGAADLVFDGDAGADGGPTGDAATEEPPSTGDASVEDAAPTCASPARCLKPPSGWEGPFAVSFSSGMKGASACPAGFGRSWERVGAADASASPAQCTCACGVIGGTCAVTLLEHDTNECKDTPKARPLLPGACLQTGGGIDGWKATATPSPSCPVDASTTFERLDASTAALGCAPSEPAGCMEGQCVPPPTAGARLCVRSISAGAPACPPEWPDMVSLDQGLEDTRACSPCACAAVTPTCAFVYTLYDSNDCTGGGGASSVSTCRSPGGIDSAKLTSASLTGSCAPSGGQSIGAVKTSPAVALCCEP